MAHLGVARANAVQSKMSQGADADAARVRALAAFKVFLTLWKDAHPDIPVLKQANAEYTAAMKITSFTFCGNPVVSDAGTNYGPLKGFMLRRGVVGLWALRVCAKTNT